MQPSMSRKGNCWDNAVAESFFHTLKTAMIVLEDFDTHEQAKTAVFEYIEVFYPYSDIYLVVSLPAADNSRRPEATDQPTHAVDFPMREEHWPRSPRMELPTRVALIDTLREEADQKRQALHHARAAQARAKEESQHAGQDTSLAQEGATLKYEQDLWQRVGTSLTEVRTLLEDIEESERQRGLSQ